MASSEGTPIKLGQRVRDKLTGFEGTVIARTEWLYGCVRLTVQSHEVKDGKPVEPYNFDEPQAELLGVTQPEPTVARHGARPDAPRRADPGRQP